MTCKLNREIVTNQNWKKFWTGSMRSTLKWITKIQSEFLFGGSVQVRPVCPRGRSPEAGPVRVGHVKLRKPYLTSRHSTMDRAEKWFAPDFCRSKKIYSVWSSVWLPLNPEKPDGRTSHYRSQSMARIKKDLSCTTVPWNLNVIWRVQKGLIRVQTGSQVFVIGSIDDITIFWRLISF